MRMRLQHLMPKLSHLRALGQRQPGNNDVRDHFCRSRRQSPTPSGRVPPLFTCTVCAGPSRTELMGSFGPTRLEQTDFHKRVARCIFQRPLDIAPDARDYRENPHVP